MYTAAYNYVSCVTGEDWHLRRTNWCGEPAELLEDEVEL